MGVAGNLNFLSVVYTEAARAVAGTSASERVAELQRGAQAVRDPLLVLEDHVDVAHGKEPVDAQVDTDSRVERPAALGRVRVGVRNLVEADVLDRGLRADHEIHEPRAREAHAELQREVRDQERCLHLVVEHVRRVGAGFAGADMT